METDDRVLRIKEVEKRVGFSRATIYRHEKLGQFPQRIKLGPRAIGWKESEVAAWMDEREKKIKAHQQRRIEESRQEVYRAEDKFSAIYSWFVVVDFLIDSLPHFYSVHGEREIMHIKLALRVALARIEDFQRLVNKAPW